MCREPDSETTRCRDAFEKGLIAAYRVQLRAEDAEECALMFAEKVFVVLVRPGSPPTHWASWLQQAALNHARDYQRTRRSRGKYEVPWPEDEAGHTTGESLPDRRPLPEGSLLQSEFWEQIVSAIFELAPGPRQLFLDHHLCGVTVAELAEASNRTEQAVVQSLARSRKRLQRLLAEAGWTKETLREYVAILTSASWTERLLPPQSEEKE